MTSERNPCSHYQKETQLSQEKKFSFRQMAEHKCCGLRTSTKSMFARCWSTARVNKHESYRTTRLLLCNLHMVLGAPLAFAADRTGPDRS
ncbi:hypothetical protein AMECASPLE_022205 [Ameca splendens]|uniref:Uncharacterized protein n=1 Tax=Ameca splendens TaxID=208324 RepID=A0ABV1AAZ4_9TELE